MQLNEFYPTPIDLVNEMLEGVNLEDIESILEPSAGKGNILDVVREMVKGRHFYNGGIVLDAIEIDENLRHILKGKEYRIVADDFLQFSSLYMYDLIIMNPPFSTGDQHLLKALQMQKYGGKIVCLLNAETLKNPYSKTRKHLVSELERHDAKIEYMQDTFTHAERKTDVEIALVRVDIPKQKNYRPLILENLDKADIEIEQEQSAPNSLITNDTIKALICEYDAAAKAGVTLIREWEAQRKYIESDFLESNEHKNILTLEIDKKRATANGYLKQLRLCYWKALFANGKIMSKLTHDYKQKYYSQVESLARYEFNAHNIFQLLLDVSATLSGGIEDTIIGLFDDLTKYHQDEYSKNIHYYDGWKTNSSYKLNKKVIIPLYIFDEWSKKMHIDYKKLQRLKDIEVTLNYLDGGKTINPNEDLDAILSRANETLNFKKVDCKYFYATFYKKGTCHIEFKDEYLLKKFNLFAGKHKQWIPPSYGRVTYDEMPQEEKSVVDEFEGVESYKNTYDNQDYYLSTAEILALNPAS